MRILSGIVTLTAHKVAKKCPAKITDVVAGDHKLIKEWPLSFSSYMALYCR